MKQLFSVLFLASASFGACQSEPTPLSELLKVAREHSPGLQIAKADIAAARARSGTRNAAYRPVISLNGVASSGDGSMIFPTSVMPSNYSQTMPGSQAVANATFMWKFWSFGRDSIARRSAAAEIQHFESGLARAESDLMRSMREAFANVLYRRDVLAARSEAYAAAKEMLRVTQAKFEEGSVPKAFVFRAQADVSTMERELAMARADLEESLAMLRESAGLDQVDPRQFGAWDEPLVAPESLKEAIEFALKSHPEVQMASWSLESAQLARQDAAKSRLPELSFMAMGDWMGTRLMPASATSKAGLVLSFPLSDGGEGSSAKKEADAMEAKMQQELRMTQLKVQASIARAFASWNSVEAQRKAAKDGLVASLEAFRVMQERYGCGDGNSSRSDRRSCSSGAHAYTVCRC